MYALAELILSLDRLQSQGREAVQQAAQAGRASRQLFEQAATLERIVRQHLILDDSALLDDYAPRAAGIPHDGAAARVAAARAPSRSRRSTR